ncbi:hypothetical protein MIND_01272500 [Mycena indigotica]|uniref:CxC2-like cysteine cluster KDZ transposase-associated domain-containing protein n=1 Tax=Mycena indigotica TaxID=2126181 RepID=A0A8H6VTE2_9AGAR|nr:uncharacterized protein MIND_01272500 [Mycena indigotica]KAF7291286.1 hypothetical protein MIND_01272500 [Mycena indigotica]
MSAHLQKRKRGRPRKATVNEQSIPNNSDDEIYDELPAAIRTVSGELLDTALASVIVEEEIPTVGKLKRSQGASTKLQDALDHLPALREQITQSLHHNPGIGCPCACGDQNAVFTCSLCSGRQMLCSACTVKQHSQHPFHRIFQWKTDVYGSAFSPISLLDLGLVLDACTNGFQPCPRASSDTMKLTVVAVNGIHELKIRLCGCRSPATERLYERWEQLLQLRLFPATFAFPRTAFDFHALEQFHVQSLTSKITVYDYIRSLEKLTDAVFPQDVTDRYREFARSFRIWRFLALERRAGQQHGIDSHVPHRTEGGLATRCPACPEVGFNISRAEIDALPDDLKYTSRLVLSVDANFKAQRKNKKTKEDSGDIVLNAGHAFFPDDQDFTEYIKVTDAAKIKEPNPEPEGIICNHFNAKTLQNMAKFKNVVISGVVAVQCARHGFFLPGALVDLTRGEAYNRTDYAVCNVLAENHLNENIAITYDIWCQYGINLPKRVQKFFNTLYPLAKLVFGGIPKMHIHNHREFCELIYNLNWLVGMGLITGEMIESSWAELNLTAGSTKEQNHGNRHDSLDEACNNWNWDKLIRLADTLVRLYCDAKLQLNRRQNDFNGHCSTVPPEKLAEWHSIPAETTFDVNGKVVNCPFELKLENGPPTHQAAYRKLMEEEFSNKKQKLGLFEGDSAIIAIGLAIERDQCSVARLVSAKRPDQEDVISNRRNQLTDKLTEFRQVLLERVPALKTLLRDPISEKPEITRLFLPSEFSAIQRDDYDLVALASIEYALREGLAHDTLQEIRNAIRAFNITINFKKTHITGTGANTRAQTHAMVQYNDIRILATGYKVQREALMRLGLPPTDTVLRPLLKKHLKGKDGQALRAGQSRELESWIWRVARPEGMSEAQAKDWQFEMDRMRYFRLRASVDRATEEINILEAEFKRCKTAFDRYAMIWAEMAQAPQSLVLGKSAYAVKKARMFAKLAMRSENARASLDKAYGDALKRQEKRDAEQAAKDAQDAEMEEEGGDQELFEVDLVRDMHTG